MGYYEYENGQGTRYYDEYMNSVGTWFYNNVGTRYAWWEVE